MLAFFGKLFASITIGILSLFGVHTSNLVPGQPASTSTQQSVVTSQSSAAAPQQTVVPAAKTNPSKTITIPPPTVPTQSTQQSQATITPQIQPTLVEQPAPTVEVSASPSTVEYDGKSAISWTATNALSCTLGSSPVLLAVSGSETVTPTDPSKNWYVANKTSYTVTCTGPGGSASSSAAVIVQAWIPPTGYQILPVGQCSMLTAPCTTGPNGSFCYKDKSGGGCGA